ATAAGTVWRRRVGACDPPAAACLAEPFRAATQKALRGTPGPGGNRRACIVRFRSIGISRLPGLGTLESRYGHSSASSRRGKPGFPLQVPRLSLLVSERSLQVPPQSLRFYRNPLRFWSAPFRFQRNPFLFQSCPFRFYCYPFLFQSAPRLGWIDAVSDRRRPSSDVARPNQAGPPTRSATPPAGSPPVPGWRGGSWRARRRR